MCLSSQVLAGAKPSSLCTVFINHCTFETQRQFLRSKNPREPEAVELYVTHPMLPQQAGAFVSLQTTEAAQNT